MNAPIEPTNGTDTGAGTCRSDFIGPVLYRVCRQCRELKVKDEFPSHPASFQGIRRDCRVCDAKNRSIKRAKSLGYSVSYALSQRVNGRGGLKDQELTHSRLTDAIDYHQETGQFFWKEGARNKTKPGSRADFLDGNKRYRVVVIDGNRYLAHRLAWFYAHGAMPSADIDHINQVKTDNRISNLRTASRSQNVQNRGLLRSNTSGKTGVFWRRNVGKWSAKIEVDGIIKYLGNFDEIDGAVAARLAAEAEYHPYTPKDQNAA